MVEQANRFTEENSVSDAEGGRRVFPLNQPVILQALFMAQFAQIELTLDQVLLYVENRSGIFHYGIDKEHLELHRQSDQQILYRLLSEEQKLNFRQSFKHHEFPDSK